MIKSKFIVPYLKKYGTIYANTGLVDCKADI